MVIDLNAHKERSFRFGFNIPAAEINLEDEALRLSGAINIEGTLNKGIAQTDIDGRISADAELECSRCLQPARQSLDFPFKAVFVTAENYTDAKEIQLGAEDLEVSIFGGDRIDVAELAREQILLALPAQVFCREDCEGFCQKCGANRNLVNCSCEEKEADPRWAALEDLK